MKSKKHFHLVHLIYDPGEPDGFLYTSGLEMIGKKELFAINVPRSSATQVAGLMNLLADREYASNEGINYQGLLMYLKSVDASRLTQLRKTHLTRVAPKAGVLELKPVCCWPKGNGTVPNCTCAECQG